MTQKQISLEEIYGLLKTIETKMLKMDRYIEDLEFARRTEEAWNEIDAGEGKSYTLKEFKKRLND